MTHNPIFGLDMKYLAICPVCNTRVSRLAFIQKNTICKNCGKTLRQIPKWDWLGNIICSSSLLLGIFLAISKTLPLPAAIAFIIISFTICCLAFPYISKHEIAPEKIKKLKPPKKTQKKSLLNIINPAIGLFAVTFNFAITIYIIYWCRQAGPLAFSIASSTRDYAFTHLNIYMPITVIASFLGWLSAHRVNYFVTFAKFAALLSTAIWLTTCLLSWFL